MFIYIYKHKLKVGEQLKFCLEKFAVKENGKKTF